MCQQLIGHQKVTFGEKYNAILYIPSQTRIIDISSKSMHTIYKWDEINQHTPNFSITHINKSVRNLYSYLEKQSI